MVFFIFNNQQYGQHNIINTVFTILSTNHSNGIYFFFSKNWCGNWCKFSLINCAALVRTPELELELKHPFAFIFKPGLILLAHLKTTCLWP